MTKKLHFLLPVFFFTALAFTALAQNAADLSETAGLPADIGQKSVTVPPGNPKLYNKNYTDRQAAYLKGKVKTVVTYEECESKGKATMLLKSREHYDPAGDLTRSLTFTDDLTCDPAKNRLLSMSYWGYYKEQRTEGRYVAGGMFEKPLREVRISTYTFDASNRPVEIGTTVKNAAVEKSTFVYGDKKTDEMRFIFDLRKEPFPYSYVLDASGNLTRQTDGPQRDYTYTKFDAKGNWLERSVVVSFGGKNPLPAKKSVRLIEYYP